MALVQTVLKGYEMLQTLIDYMPLPMQAFFQLVFAVFCYKPLVAVIKWFVGGD